MAWRACLRLWDGGIGWARIGAGIWHWRPPAILGAERRVIGRRANRAADLSLRIEVDGEGEEAEKEEEEEADGR